MITEWCVSRSPPEPAPGTRSSVGGLVGRAWEGLGRLVRHVDVLHLAISPRWASRAGPHRRNPKAQNGRPLKPEAVGRVGCSIDAVNLELARPAGL